MGNLISKFKVSTTWNHIPMVSPHKEGKVKFHWPDCFLHNYICISSRLQNHHASIQPLGLHKSPWRFLSLHCAQISMELFIFHCKDLHSVFCPLHQTQVFRECYVLSSIIWISTLSQWTIQAIRHYQNSREFLNFKKNFISSCHPSTLKSSTMRLHLTVQRLF